VTLRVTLCACVRACVQYEDFNYHPLFKHYGDEFSAVPFKPLPKEQL
jgi:hypothetical protein